MNTNEKIIEIKHISKSFGDKCILNDVSLYVKRGEFLTLLGPSGCGKTTLLRILAGFGSADSGEILINGKDITGVPPHERPVNTVFQRYALFPHLDVYENIAFGLKLKKMPTDEIDKKVRKALKMVSMTDYEDRDVESLSGGQQQRVAIARAIVNEPSVLLLDEPLSALDLKMRKDMQMELKEMHREYIVSRLLAYSSINKMTSCLELKLFLLCVFEHILMDGELLCILTFRKDSSPYLDRVADGIYAGLAVDLHKNSRILSNRNHWHQHCSQKAQSQ